MKSFSLPAILNSLIVFAFSFFIVIIPFGFIDLSPALRVIFSLAIAFSVSFCAYGIFGKNEERKRDIKCKKVKETDALFTLNTRSQKQIQKIFGELLNKLGLVYKRNNGYFSVNGISVLPVFLPEELNFNELLKLYRNRPFDDEKLVIISDRFSSDLSCSEKLIMLRTKSVIPLFEKYDLLPKIDKAVKPERKLLKALFYKTNGKKLILYGACLIALGFFVFYPVYYFVSGTIFFVYGLIALFFGKIKPFDHKDDLLTLLNENKR